MLRESLEAGKPRLVDRITGPVSVFAADAGSATITVLCEDAADRQGSDWDHELRDGPVCSLDEAGGEVICVVLDTVNQRMVMAVFEDATSRLVGIAHAPTGVTPALLAWRQLLGLGEPASCK